MGTAESETIAAIAQSGLAVHERLAPFPLWDEYGEMLKSHIADLKNIGGREAGAITAGKFLQHFTDYPWVHIDIAGPAFLDGESSYRANMEQDLVCGFCFIFLKNVRNERKTPHWHQLWRPKWGRHGAGPSCPQRPTHPSFHDPHRLCAPACR